MLYTQVVNLPSANVAYKLQTLLVAVDPNAPAILGQGKIKPVSSNAGSVAIGNANMASVLDGDELNVGDWSDEASGAPGMVLDTNSTYVIGSAVNQKIVVKGQTY